LTKQPDISRLPHPATPGCIRNVGCRLSNQDRRRRRHPHSAASPAVERPPHTHTITNFPQHFPSKPTPTSPLPTTFCPTAISLSRAHPRLFAPPPANLATTMNPLQQRQKQAAAQGAGKTVHTHAPTLFRFGPPYWDASYDHVYSSGANRRLSTKTKNRN
jgi:hypothetical protein